MAVKPIYIVCGLAYGDEGKGRTVDYLADRFGLDKVIRFNGGTQAAHNVVLPDGRHHVFSQIGSASFLPHVQTYLAAPTLFSPINLNLEAKAFDSAAHCGSILDRIHIDEDCPLVTPFHALMNRLRESSRGERRHGSCGKGVGEAAYDSAANPQLALYARDLKNLPHNALLHKLAVLQNQKLASARLIVERCLTETCRQYLTEIQDYDLESLTSEYMVFGQYLKIVPHWAILAAINNGNAVFEGAQGALLDQDLGFAPYVTSSKTGFDNALELIHDADYPGQPVKLAVMRPYFTRHGAGPFVTENPALDKIIPPCHNCHNQWQGEFRLGDFDFVAARYALNCLGGVDGLVVSNLDRLPASAFDQSRICNSYLVAPEDAPLAEPYFSLIDIFGPSEYLAIRIKHKPILGPESAMERTAILSRCRPHFMNLRLTNHVNELSDHPFVNTVESLLGAPVVMVSNSPDRLGVSCSLQDS